MNKLKQALKNIAAAWWLLWIITVGVLDIRYGWPGLGKFFRFNQPLGWWLLAAIVLTIAAALCPPRKKKGPK